MRSAWIILGLAGGLAFSASLTLGATITGTVTGPDRAPFEGAFVQALNPQTQILVSVLTDRAGRYRVPDLPAGDYEVSAKAAGFGSETPAKITLSAEQTHTLAVALSPAPVRWQELSVYQGRALLPDGPGKQVLIHQCFFCHGFQTRMAARAPHDAAGWRALVDYMVSSEHYFVSSVSHLTLDQFAAQDETELVSYLTENFGPDSTLPAPTALPGYQQVKPAPFSDAAMKIVYVEYAMPQPNLMPWSGFPDKDGRIWIPFFGDANAIGRLDPKTGKVEVFRAPNQGTAGIHSAVAAPDGSVWFTEQGSNKLGHWDPATQKITEFRDAYRPGKENLLAGGSKHTLVIAPDGEIWASGGPLSRFDPKTGKFTDIAEIPTAYGIALDADGNAWFTEFTPEGKIGKVDAKTLRVTKWAVPTGAAMPRRIVVDRDGMVWFGEYRTGQIGRFDPKTGHFTEYRLPGAMPTPYALAVDATGHVWYSSENMDVIGRLDPETGKVTVYPVPQSENSMREFFPDRAGRMWFGSPSNDKVGYFYLAE